MHEVSSRLGECIGGKYRLDALLGVGGMGEVYRATHVVLERTVAIKLLRPEYAGVREVVARFVREAKAASLVRHRNVVEVIDVGADAEGVPYIVQEHLIGEDFAALLERYPEGVPPGLAMSVLVPVVDAVAAAHDKGVVHRDLKPENVFLAQEGGVALPKVLDFGISKLPDSDAASTRLTAVDTLMGSPNYMSPEQIQTPREVDRRSDIWSLGVMLFECLSGRYPYDATTAQHYMVKICRERPLSLDEVAPHLPTELVHIVTRCLERDPALRYAHAGELRDALKLLRSRPASLPMRPGPRAAARAVMQDELPVPAAARPATGAGFATRTDAHAVQSPRPSSHAARPGSRPSAFELDATARGSVRPRSGTDAPARPRSRPSVPDPVLVTRVDADADATAVDAELTPRDSVRTPVDSVRTVVDARSPTQVDADAPLARASRPSAPAVRGAPLAMAASRSRADAAPARDRDRDPDVDSGADSGADSDAGADLDPDLYPIGGLDFVLAVLVLLVLGFLVPAIGGGRAAEGVRLLGNALPLWGLGVAAALILACTRTIMLGLDNRSVALFVAAAGLLALPGCFVILSTALGWPRAPLAAQAPFATQVVPWATLAVYGGCAVHALQRVLHAVRERRVVQGGVAVLFVIACVAGGYTVLQGVARSAAAEAAPQR